MIKFFRRLRCHGNGFLCCQYVDLPTCNSPRDTHRYGRAAWRHDAAVERSYDRENFR